MPDQGINILLHTQDHMPIAHLVSTVEAVHHPHRTHDHHAHQRSGSQDQHRFLDLDAEVFGEHLAAVLDLTGVPAARSVVDLGAGTGAGSRLLRERYPDAALTCVDNDPQMLELLRGQGFPVVEADLDDGFPRWEAP